MRRTAAVTPSATSIAAAVPGHQRKGAVEQGVRRRQQRRGRAGGRIRRRAAVRSRRAPAVGAGAGSLSRAPVQPDPVLEAAHRVRRSPSARSPRPRPRHPPVRSRTAGPGTACRRAGGRAVWMIRLMTLSASMSGCAARTSAAMPATIGAAPLVPFHSTSRPSAETPTRSSLGADTPIVMPCVDASTLALPCGSTPATVSTPGIVAGAPTRVVPLPRLPAATTTTTSLSNA